LTATGDYDSLSYPNDISQNLERTHATQDQALPIVMFGAQQLQDVQISIHPALQSTISFEHFSLIPGHTPLQSSDSDVYPGSASTALGSYTPTAGPSCGSLPQSSGTPISGLWYYPLIVGQASASNTPLSPYHYHSQASSSMSMFTHGNSSMPLYLDDMHSQAHRVPHSAALVTSLPSTSGSSVPASSSTLSINCQWNGCGHAVYASTSERLYQHLREHFEDYHGEVMGRQGGAGGTHSDKTCLWAGCVCLVNRGGRCLKLKLASGHKAHVKDMINHVWKRHITGPMSKVSKEYSNSASRRHISG
jgi:hypothetical protein